jgi:hypothetical protein
VAHRGQCGEAAAENRKATLTAALPPSSRFLVQPLDLKSIHYFCFTIEVLFFLVWLGLSAREDVASGWPEAAG